MCGLLKYNNGAWAPNPDSARLQVHTTHGGTAIGNHSFQLRRSIVLYIYNRQCTLAQHSTDDAEIRCNISNKWVVGTFILVMHDDMMMVTDTVQMCHNADCLDCP